MHRWIDAHHHLWDLEQVHYPWLMAKGEARFFGQPDPIRKNYLPSNFIADHQNVIVNSVHVQVGATKQDEIKETAWLAKCSQQTNNKFPTKLVVAIDMLANNVEKKIAQHRQYPDIQGVRHIIGKSVEENKTLPLFDQDKWLSALTLLQKHHLSFDLQLTQEQYLPIFTVLKQLPELNVAICHLASPWDQSPEAFTRWCHAMKQFTTLPNCFIKLSGFSMFNHGMDKKKFKLYAHSAIEIFGTKRCMFGSNFPVDKLYISYQ
ncbi:MAG: putative TIM-barrel fold metal-dependent hydrolase [Cognaticolwellia sp.]|jgi:predicted TIM-barrel fold metal-dependent hydrolase